MKHSEDFNKLFDPFEIERMRQKTTTKTTIPPSTEISEILRRVDVASLKNNGISNAYGNNPFDNWVSETQSKYRDERTGYPEQQPVYNNIDPTPSNIVNVIDYLPTYHNDGTLLTVDEIINNVKKYFDHK